ncbi:DUF262 domain-containing protein [Tenacibaculum sp. 190524A02b]|uniref:DUF262 domain-containing protein n=1 Tax=Tenacibaculum vairaonense TaxID=3137860 RepID=UPI0032B2E2F4
MDFTNKINVKPEIDRLINILDSVKKGRLVVPEFQRDYVWDKKQRIDLFDSIKRGFPIGSLLFWNPDGNDYEYNNNIGPYKLDITPNKFSYIIDGYQRVTTLFSALINPYDTGVILKQKDKLQEYIVYYDLENQEFSQPYSKNNIEPQYIPLYVLVDTFEFLSFSDKLKDFFNEEKSTKFINRAKKLATTLLDYSLSYVNINGGTIQDSVEIFSRINSKGSDMSPMWMLSALTYKDGFKFSEEIDKLKLQLSEYNFDDLKTEIILQCIETSTGKIYFDVKTESLARRNDFKNLCFKTFESLKKAILFLYEELNVLNYKLLPYNVQLVFITDFFRLNQFPSKNQIEELKKWFWRTSYSNYFTIYSLSKQRRAFSIFKDFCLGKINNPFYIESENDSFVTSDFPKTINLGSVRAKSLALFLIKNVINSSSLLKDDKELEDFYSLIPNKRQAELMFPKFKSLNYSEDKQFYRKKRKRDYTFILENKINSFDYENNFVPSEPYINGFLYSDIAKDRYNLIAKAEQEFVQKLGIIYNYDYSKIDFTDFEDDFIP